MSPELIVGLVAVSAVIFFLGKVFYYRQKKLGRIAKPDQISIPQKTEAESDDSQAITDLTKEKPIPIDRVSQGLSKSKAFFQQALDRLFAGSTGEQFYQDVEEALLTADVGIDFSEKVIQNLKSEWGLKIPDRGALKQALKLSMLRALENQLPNEHSEPLAIEFEKAIGLTKPKVVMIIGVNGAGKTTTIGKLCSRYRAQGKSVLVGAADTFRAAATEQLRAWVERSGAQGVFQKEGSDPSAVAFDTVQSAVSRGVDICIIDTAGRLHTKANLMEELKKMRRVVQKAMPDAPHEIWLVLDGTMGQNALNQAKEFHQSLGLTGLIITKLDGSAKGGAVLAISSDLKLPVIFIGVGESVEDLVPFEGHKYIETLLAEV